ncbi:MAG: alkaline phosphatase family protein, partial [Chloroflexota bacterium]|nr:alkaline phosphatase family protein [Chloroflexota bacterium]
SDFTGEGWRSYLGFEDIPILSLHEAGKRLALLAQETDLLLFDYWQTDVVGHRGSMNVAIDTIERLDAVIGGIIASWSETDGLIVVVSDHGNLEDKTTRRHTCNKVPVLLFGDGHSGVASAINDLTDIAPALIEYLV